MSSVPAYRGQRIETSVAVALWKQPPPPDMFSKLPDERVATSMLAVTRNLSENDDTTPLGHFSPNELADDVRRVIGEGKRP